MDFELKLREFTILPVCNVINELFIFNPCAARTHSFSTFHFQFSIIYRSA